MAKPPRLVHGSLHGGVADPGLCGDCVDRQVARTMIHDLKADDAQHGTLAFGVVAQQIVRKRALTAEAPPAITRCFAVGRPRALTGNEPAMYAAVDAAVDAADLDCLPRRVMTAQGTPALDDVGKIARLGVTYLAGVVTLPDQPAGLIELMHVAGGVDHIIKRLAVRTKRLICNLVCQLVGNAHHERALRAAGAAGSIRNRTNLAVLSNEHVHQATHASQFQPPRIKAYRAAGWTRAHFRD